MIDETTARRLIGSVYDAALRPERWPNFLSALGAAVDASVAALVSHDFASHHGAASHTVGLDPEGARLYNAHYHSSDPWARNISLFSVGQVVLGQRVTTHLEMRRTAYYQEFGHVYRLVSMMGIALERRGSKLTSFLSINRGDDQPLFGPEEAALTQVVAPHALRALQIGRRLQAVQVESRTLEDALDRLSVALMLLAADGRVVFVNRLASRIVGQADGLAIKAGRAAVCQLSESTTLALLVAGAGRSAAGKGWDAGGALRVSRPSGRRPLEILVTPLPLPDAFGLGRGSCVALFITDPEMQSPSQGASLRRQYGLTRAESEVAAALGNGFSIAEIAEQRQTTTTTTRWFVRQVLEKTGTRAQADIVRICARLRWMRDGD